MRQGSARCRRCKWGPSALSATRTWASESPAGAAARAPKAPGAEGPDGRHVDGSGGPTRMGFGGRAVRAAGAARRRHGPRHGLRRRAPGPPRPAHATRLPATQMTRTRLTRMKENRSRLGRVARTQVTRAGATRMTGEHLPGTRGAGPPSPHDLGTPSGRSSVASDSD